jgi:hypothetical protein
VPPDTLTVGSVINVNPATTDSCVLNKVQYIAYGATLNVMPGRRFVVQSQLFYLSFINPVLTQVFELDTALNPPFDTVYRHLYQYDVQGRLSRSTWLRTNQLGDSTNITILDYEYAGTDTLAFRTFEDRSYYSSIPSPGWNRTLDTTVYFYENNKLSYDSSFGLRIYDGIRTFQGRRYGYEPNNIITISRNSYSTGSSVTPSTSTSRVYQTFSMGDIVHQVDSSKYVSSMGTTYYRFENTVTYINNPNPFAAISDPIRRPLLGDDIGLGAVRSSPHKLYTQHHWQMNEWGSYTQSLQDDVQYTFTFRADGCPAEALQTFSSGRVKRFLFIYR